MTCKITIVYDNNPYAKGLEAAWGFSCFLETSQENVLFDTGGDGEILLTNMKKLGIEVSDINNLVISHNHYDHAGGMMGVLDQHSKLTVYVPESFPQESLKNVKNETTIVRVSDSVNITPQIFSTGVLGDGVKEQALVVRTDRGLIVITGCAHPGIVTIIKKAIEIAIEIAADNKVLLVVGGFHLLDKTKAEIQHIIAEFKRLGVELVAPCHCTGDKAIQLFQEEYGENFVPAGVGKIIDVGSF